MAQCGIGHHTLLWVARAVLGLWVQHSWAVPQTTVVSREAHLGPHTIFLPPSWAAFGN